MRTDAVYRDAAGHRPPAGEQVHEHVADRPRRRRDSAGLRLHQRVPRHRERDGHVDRDRGARAAHRRRRGGRAEPRRSLPLGGGRQDHLRWAGRRGADHAHGGLRGARRSDPVEPGHVDVRAAVELVARADRRARRGGRRRRRARRGPLASSAREGRAAGGGLAGARRARRPRGDPQRLPHHRPRRRRDGAARVPARPGGVRIDRRAGARGERRAEDDGRDHARPDRGGRARPRLRLRRSG